MSSIELFEKQYKKNTQKNAAREKAWESFIRQGLPTLRNENWKYTNIQPIFKQALVIPDLAQENKQKSNFDYSALIQSTHIANMPCYRLVIIDGQFNAEFSSLPASAEKMEIIPLSFFGEEVAGAQHERVRGILKKIMQTSESLHEKHPFAALNAALAQNGFFCWIKPNTTIDKPLEILHINTALPNAFYSARQIFLLDHHTQAEIIERFINLSETHHILNTRTDIIMEDSSSLKHYRLDEQSNSAVHLNFISVTQEKKTHFESFALDLGGQLIRTDLITKLAAPGAECVLNGFYNTNGKELVDNHTLIEHASQHCTSKQFYKGIIDGSSRAVFNGKVLVCDGAYATDAAQQNKNLLLSKTADINTKPELEIYADEVKCSHGSTVGQLNEESIFYLQARGIPREQAKSLLLYAFAQEMVEKIKNKAIADYAINKVLAKFPDSNVVKECFE